MKKRFWMFITGGCAAVVIAAALSLVFGSTEVPLEKIWQALTAPDLTDQGQIVVYELRLPRALGCMLVGAAFAAAGAIMQGVTRNPLADSGLLGINAGASFALALCLALLSGVSFSATVLFSFLGAAASLAVVYLLMSLKHRKLDPVRLVLAGSAVSMFLSSISQAVSIYFNIGFCGAGDCAWFAAGAAAFTAGIASEPRRRHGTWTGLAA